MPIPNMTTQPGVRKAKCVTSWQTAGHQKNLKAFRCFPPAAGWGGSGFAAEAHAVEGAGAVIPMFQQGIRSRRAVPLLATGRTPLYSGQDDRPWPRPAAFVRLFSDSWTGSSAADAADRPKAR